MAKKKLSLFLTLLLLLATACQKASTQKEPPKTFKEAKLIVYELTKKINNTTLYCQCPIIWTNKKYGKPDLKKCGYTVRKQKQRANRIEIEHIVPASFLGKNRQCWLKGGRKNCIKSDKLYNQMSANLYNLWPAVGEVNADRSNYPFNIVTKPGYIYGRKKFKIDFKKKIAEPPDDVKGLVARTYLYMNDKYNLNLSKEQRKLYQNWNRKYPAKDWEKQREQAIKTYQGETAYYN
ncbi:MAG: endonuclease [Endozoicomonadaceae bacterium]|nr:endonuclease [Endozoicomonadaceae bacterium]